ncbi:YjbH domain-containing protein [Rhodobacter sp. Har01]|uniref:YjbH domain-containing protein n=1 Tax=Rhodobacter sp. Har01 TaxID=2883999 RepID=UPI001D074561|nr:YjbH domain-containing protein [Rhodobacter sp. Har01]MCB6178034.1 YjbH domain-containing protein [Rhodobacter sp. Har01]
MAGRRQRLLATAAWISALSCDLSAPALAEMKPTLSFRGVPGVIDMPSGESQPDGTFSVTAAFFGDMRRGALTFQLSPRIAATYRFETVGNWNALFPADENSYDGKSFDLRFTLLEETANLPAVTLGLQDIFNTGNDAAEYLAATKTFGDRLKVTAGLGWGRLGSYGDIGTPFGGRPVTDFGLGGQPEPDNWFRGPAAAFAGVEWKINDAWTVKAEYSSDGYDEIAGTRGVFEHKSPLNFGVEYSRGRFFKAGVYSLYGSEIGLRFQLVLDPKTALHGGATGGAPVAVGQRPTRAADPEAYDSGWVTQPDAAGILQANLAKRLAVDGIAVEGLAYTAGKAQLRIRSNRMDSESQVVGRVARAMSHVMPASVEVFEIVPVSHGMGTSKITVRRADLEALEHVAGNHAAMRDRIAISDAGPVPPGLVYPEDRFPKFSWGLRPALRLTSNLKGDVGLRLRASYEFRPGLVLSGSVYKPLADNLGSSPADPSLLPPVRSRSIDYSRNGDPGLETLQLAWYARPGENLYSRVSLGYLERMHAGVSGELLWKPVDSRLALGIEVNHTRQRDTDGGFGFSEFDYSVTSGHVSAYYDFGRGYLGQLDVGRYLAGDVGATLSLDREFANGWRFGAFATVTDATAAEFGEGSFDKGVRITMPLDWLLGKDKSGEFSRTFRPNSGDGGARLDVSGRLYDNIRTFHGNELDDQWGTFWR